MPVFLFRNLKYSAFIFLQRKEKNHSQDATGNDFSCADGQAVVAETL